MSLDPGGAALPGPGPIIIPIPVHVKRPVISKQSRGVKGGNIAPGNNVTESYIVPVKENGMIENKILRRIRDGQKALGLAMSDPSEELIELAGRTGLDYVSFDGQHSPLTPERVGQLCRVADGFDITPAMRIPDQQETTILEYLDKGVRMVTVPNLKTKQEAEDIVRFCYFAPIGLRSATSHRMRMSQTGTLAELYDDVNANTMVVCQLESATAFNNLDEILTVSGIDYFAGGPQDIAQSMGLAGQPDHPSAVAAYEQACDRVRSAGKWVVGDLIESIDVFHLVRGTAADLMRSHGREPGISSWA